MRPRTNSVTGEVLPTPCGRHPWHRFQRADDAGGIVCLDCGIPGVDPAHVTVPRALNPEEFWPFGPPVSGLDLQVGAMSDAEFERLQLAVRQRTRERDLGGFVQGLTDDMFAELMRQVDKRAGDVWMGQPIVEVFPERRELTHGVFPTGVCIQVDCRSRGGRLHQATLSLDEWRAFVGKIDATLVLEGLKGETREAGK